MASRSAQNPVVFVAALLVTWLAWGSSFVAIEYVLAALPPLLLMATRFVAAGAIAFAAGWWLARRAGSRTAPSAREWRDAAVVGAGFVLVGMGATSWAASRLPSSVTALFVATAPLWVVALQLVGSRGRSANAWTLLGVLAGTAGVAVLVAPGSGGGIDAMAGAVLVLANGVWAATMAFARTAARPQSLLQSVGMQMLTGGAMLAVVAVAAGEPAHVRAGELGALVTGSWLFLVLIASLGGFVAYGWLLEHASATTASTHAFVNPLVAVALGAVLLGEVLDVRVLIASSAIVAAVVLLMAGEARAPGRSPQGQRRRRRRAPAPAAGVAARPPALGTGRGGRRLGWSPAPTPSFAARREARPFHATDGMDALAIDDALDGFGS